MQHHRVAARGSATSFPLPWQDLLVQLESNDDANDAGAGPDLPRSGEELSNFVSILLNTSDEGDTKESLSKFIHQALVRRDVVVGLIEKAKRRGHRAYKNIDMTRVRAKAAATLPENDVPPEIQKLIPYDDSLDRILIQKQATPVPNKCSLETAAANLDNIRPNGVVLEKTSYDEGDIRLCLQAIGF